MAIGRAAFAAALLFLGCSGPALCQDADSGQALAFTVRPSGVEPELGPAAGPGSAETLDEKLERRFRQTEAMFRRICVGCNHDGAGGSDGPFRPVQTLGRPIPEEAPLPPAPE